jgi:hypothetical protein
VDEILNIHQTVFRGEPGLAIEHVERAIQLSPVDAFMFFWQSAGAYGHFFLDRYDDALSWTEKALREREGYLPGLRMSVSAAALAGEYERSKASLTRLRD